MKETCTVDGGVGVGVWEGARHVLISTGVAGRRLASSTSRLEVASVPDRFRDPERPFKVAGAAGSMVASPVDTSLS